MTIKVTSAQVDFLLGADHHEATERHLFVEIKEKLAFLRQLSEIDELFLCLASSYLEFENERNQLRNAFHVFTRGTKFGEYLRTMNVRLLSVLTWSRCFFDIGKSKAPQSGFPDRIELKSKCFSFLLMEYIRNKSQHAMLPIHEAHFSYDRTFLEQKAPDYFFTKDRIEELPIFSGNSYDQQDRDTILARVENEFDVSVHLLTYMQTIQADFVRFRKGNAERHAASYERLSKILDAFSELLHNDDLIFEDTTSGETLRLMRYELNDLTQSNEAISEYLSYAMCPPSPDPRVAGAGAER